MIFLDLGMNSAFSSRLPPGFHRDFSRK
jgi:hypothetical protein